MNEVAVGNVVFSVNWTTGCMHFMGHNLEDYFATHYIIVIQKTIFCGKVLSPVL